MVIVESRRGFRRHLRGQKLPSLEMQRAGLLSLALDLGASASSALVCRRASSSLK
jgi:hypothetical protein